jgi:hypothetical protein
MRLSDRQKIERIRKAMRFMYRNAERSRMVQRDGVIYQEEASVAKNVAKLEHNFTVCAYVLTKIEEIVK